MISQVLTLQHILLYKCVYGLKGEKIPLKSYWYHDKIQTQNWTFSISCGS